jgi:hypothetical protein
MALLLDLLPIPDVFRWYLCSVPKTIVLETTIDCFWMVKAKNVNERIELYQE